MCNGVAIIFASHLSLRFSLLYAPPWQSSPSRFSIFWLMLLTSFLGHFAMTFGSAISTKKYSERWQKLHLNLCVEANHFRMVFFYDPPCCHLCPTCMVVYGCVCVCQRQHLSPVVVHQVKNGKEHLAHPFAERWAA